MITWANLRASAAPWLVLPILIYAGLYIDDAVYTAPSKYGVQSGELASHAVAAIVPAVAAAAAWEAGRHRLLGVLSLTGRRGPLRRFLRAVVPVLILLLVLVLGALGVAIRAVGVLPAGAGWLAVAHLVVLSCGWLVIGWCLGLVIPRSVAAAVAAIGCWAWLAMPHAMSNSWLRHLGGFIDGESSVTDVLSPTVYLIPWGVVFGLALAFWVLCRMRSRVGAVTVALLVVAATLIVGRSMVADWGYGNPTHPRRVAMACVGQAPRVCVPPEYEPYAEQLRRDALAPIQRLKAAGIVAPQELRVSSRKTSLKPGTWPLDWALPPRGSDPDPADYVIVIAESAVAGTAERAGVRDCRQHGSLAAAWAALTAGVSEENLQTMVAPPDWATIQKTRRMPAHEQTEWFTKASMNPQRCAQGVS